MCCNCLNWQTGIINSIIYTCQSQSTIHCLTYNTTEQTYPICVNTNDSHTYSTLIHTYLEHSAKLFLSYQNFHFLLSLKLWYPFPSPSKYHFLLCLELWYPFPSPFPTKYHFQLFLGILIIMGSLQKVTIQMIVKSMHIYVRVGEVERERESELNSDSYDQIVQELASKLADIKNCNNTSFWVCQYGMEHLAGVKWR